MKTIEDVLELIDEEIKSYYSQTYIGIQRKEVLRKLKSKIKESQMRTFTKKPPLGLIPAYIRKAERIQEIQDAIQRYQSDDMAIPSEWTNELRTLIDNEMEPKLTSKELDELLLPSTPKPFDIDRCLNEDGGRCTYTVTKEEFILVGKHTDRLGLYILLDGNKFIRTVESSDLRNIPRRKEEWINVWKDGAEYIICSNIPYPSREQAFRYRKIASSLSYIGDPVCISSEEI